MKKVQNWVLAAILIISGFGVLTSCSDDTTLGVATQIKGRWTTAEAGAAEVLWGGGKALRMTEFATDGTGCTDIYYLLSDDIAIARSHRTFRYTATADGQLTLSMDDNQATETFSWSVTDGNLMLNAGDRQLTLRKSDEASEQKMAAWNADPDIFTVPAPARYTVFVYGNAEGDMDNIIEEGLWDRLKPVLTDPANVRVVCFYKYGKDTNSKYDHDGDIVWFELNSTTDLNNLKNEGLQAHVPAQVSEELKLCDPSTLRMVMRFSSLFCPASNYVFAIWGHGNGFDPTCDVPGKYDTDQANAARGVTRGVIGDEWNDDEQLDMYELSGAIRSVSARPFDNIFFHNCLMGNLETLSQLSDITGYIACSAHLLSSNGEILTEYIRGLIDKGNTPEAIDQMFINADKQWRQDYLDESPTQEPGPSAINGDFKLLRADRLAAVTAAAKRFADRLVAQYPAMRPAIDRATCKVYRFITPQYFASFLAPFFDLADYAHKVAEETADKEFADIAAQLDAAFADAIVSYVDINWNSAEFLPHYTLSVCLVDHDIYTADFVNNFSFFNPLVNFNQGYEQSAFHRLTGWGAWLNTNLQLPTGNPTSGGHQSPE